jgi:hypothetical protein
MFRVFKYDARCGARMLGLKFRFGWCFILLTGSLLLLTIPTRRALAQQPTVAIPTVTGTPSGPMLTVHPGYEEQINVRAGPGADYDAVGILVIGQWVPALGQLSSRDWIEIAYMGAPDNIGWVLAAIVDVLGEVPVIDAPPTPTPRTTPTIDPTLASQYIVEIPATRLPTYTMPDPLTTISFPSETPLRGGSGVPMGLVIIGLGVVGLFGALISLLRGR